jgi:hypothetical protein
MSYRRGSDSISAQQLLQARLFAFAHLLGGIDYDRG